VEFEESKTRSEEKILRSLSEPVFKNTGREDLLQSLYFLAPSRRTLIIALSERATFGSHGGRVPTTSLLTRYFTVFPCAQKATSATKSESVFPET
jgi:hypothetical protein